MNASEALAIVTSLASGKNPATQEQYSTDSLYQQPDVIRALFLAREALARRATLERRRKHQATNTGQPWTTEEESSLLEDYEKGVTIPELARLFQRSPLAVRARLVKLGKIEDDGSLRFAM